MKDSKLGDTPIAKGDKFSLKQCPNNDLERIEMQKIPYASAIGSLMYAQVCTRPDIAFVAGVLGRYSSNPGMQHWKAAKYVMCYLKRTKYTCSLIRSLRIWRSLGTQTLILLDVKIANAPHLDTYLCWLLELSLGSLLNRLS